MRQIKNRLYWQAIALFCLFLTPTVGLAGESSGFDLIVGANPTPATYSGEFSQSYKRVGSSSFAVRFATKYTIDFWLPLAREVSPQL